MAVLSSDESSLTPDDLRFVDEVCNRFESQWKAGSQPRLEDFVGAAGPAVRCWILEELIMLDCHYRHKFGETPVRAEYLSRFPHDVNIVHGVFDRTSSHLGDTSTSRGNSTDTDHADDSLSGSSEASRASGPKQTFLAKAARGDDADRYELLEEIGAGGIGRIFRARPASGT